VIQPWRRVIPAAIAMELMLLPAPLPAATAVKQAATPLIPPAPPVTPSAAPVKPGTDTSAIAELGATRAQCIAIAHNVQQGERTVGALDLAIGVMERGAKAKQQQFDLNGKEEEQLLGALERLTRASPAALALSEGPIDRVRSGILLASALPTLQVQAQGLSAQLATLAAERAHIDARRPEFDAARQALNKAREALAPLIAKRGDLIAKLLPPNDGKAPDGVKPGEQTSDLADLIKRADADTDRRDKQLLARLRAGPALAKKSAPPPADPTRPPDLRALDAPHATLTWPVMGDVSHRFGDADRLGRPSLGLSLGASPAALVIVPFDGQVEFAGNYTSYGLILIIRHRGGYHSVLAGLGRVDVTIGQWLLAGEPVGVMPGANDENASVTFYLELRRDGRPVDPQSRLARRE
jgi:septal ring factor EnvC (AmiA/AmiB activator)